MLGSIPGGLVLACHGACVLPVEHLCLRFAYTCCVPHGAAEPGEVIRLFQVKLTGSIGGARGLSISMVLSACPRARLAAP